MSATEARDVRAFCSRDAVSVARDLIGCSLLFAGAGGRIVETEAYTVDDPASHSFRGMTSANAAMFGPPGTSYVYRIYGLHQCLNVVCAGASAVLIRALEPTEGVAEMSARRGPVPVTRLCRGPGNLCAALGVNLGHNGLPLDAFPFHLAPGEGPDVELIEGPRIGISRNTDIAWRFGLAGSACLSRPFPQTRSRSLRIREGTPS